MKHLFFVAFFLTPFLTNAQFNSSLDFVAGLDYSFRTLSAEASDSTLQSIIDSRNDRETAKLNWRTGFNYNKRLTGNIYLKTGVRLSNLGYKSEYTVAGIWPGEHDGNGQGNPIVTTDEFKFVYDYWFLELPIAARYELNNKKWSPFIEIGFAPSIFLTGRTEKTQNGETSISYGDPINTGTNTLHLSGFLSVGVNYTVNNNIQLFGQTSFRYHLTPLADTSITGNLYNYGIEFGARKRIGPLQPTELNND